MSKPESWYAQPVPAGESQNDLSAQRGQLAIPFSEASGQSTDFTSPNEIEIARVLTFLDLQKYPGEPQSRAKSRMIFTEYLLQRIQLKDAEVSLKDIYGRYEKRELRPPKKWDRADLIATQLVMKNSLQKSINLNEIAAYARKKDDTVGPGLEFFLKGDPGLAKFNETEKLEKMRQILSESKTLYNQQEPTVSLSPIKLVLPLLMMAASAAWQIYSILAHPEKGSSQLSWILPFGSLKLFLGMLPTSLLIYHKDKLKRNPLLSAA